MTCEELLERRDLLLDFEAGRGTLSSGEVESLRLHLAECERCRSTAAECDDLASWFRSLPALAPPEEMLPWENESRAPGGWRRVALVSLAAAACIVVVFGVFHAGKQGRRAVESFREPPARGDGSLERVPHDAAAKAAIAVAGSADVPEDDALRPRAQETAARALDDAGKLEEALQSYTALLREHPKDSAAERVSIAIARILTQLNRKEEAVLVLEKARAAFAWRGNPLCFAVAGAWNSLHSRGDLLGMEEWVKLAEIYFPAELVEQASDAAHRQMLSDVMDYTGFRKGYTHFALGDYDRASRAFKAHIDSLMEKEKTFGSLDNVCVVYRMRSLDNLAFLGALAGRPAPMDLELGEAWATPEKVRIADSKGKPVALVFRGVGDERSAAFLGPFSRVCAEHQGVQLATISYLKDGETLASSKEKQLEELKRIDYRGAAGFDPDAATKRLFHAYMANVGSATFFIVNPRGELIWLLQDPRSIDVELATKLLLRVARS